MFISVLAAAVTCFEDNAVVSANSLDSTVTLKLQTMKELDNSCLGAIGDPDTKAEIHYYIGSENVIETPFVFTGPGYYEIVFTINDPTDFKNFEELNNLHYEILLKGTLPSLGSVQTILHTQMNATNCWSDILLEYSRIPGSEYIEFTGNPLNCEILSPSVSLEYKVGLVWKEFAINGDSSYGNDYYKGSSGYVFRSIKYYKEELSKLDAGNQANFKEMMELFAKDRNFECRIKLLAGSIGSEQVVLGQVINKRSEINSCFAKMEPNLFITQEYIILTEDQGSYSSIAECPQAMEEVSLTSLVYLPSGDVFPIPEIVVTKNEFVERGGLSYYLDTSAIMKEQQEEYQYASYLTYLGNDSEIIAEESYSGVSEKSCIEDIIYSLKGEKLCVEISYEDELRCKFEGLKEYTVMMITDAFKNNSRVTYLAYEINVTYTTKEERFCSTTESEKHIGTMQSGSFSARSEKFKKEVAQHTKILAIFENFGEYMITNYIIVEDTTKLLLTFLIVFVSVTVIVLTGSIIMVVNELKKSK